jgi:hypothetical protein
MRKSERVFDGLSAGVETNRVTIWSRLAAGSLPREPLPFGRINAFKCNRICRHESGNYDGICAREEYASRTGQQLGGFSMNKLGIQSKELSFRSGFSRVIVQVCLVLLTGLVSLTEAQGPLTAGPPVPPNPASTPGDGQKSLFAKGIVINLDDKAAHAPLVDPAFLAHPPCFIAFTGKREFFFRKADVANLRVYLHEGGCIWALRDDVPFKREMVRLLTESPRSVFR